MARIKSLNSIDQRNLWGAQGEGLDGQRVDLFAVDLSNVVTKINADHSLGLPDVYPQFAHSVTLPEERIKADTFRRNSIPFQMPSWDDPLEAVRVTFLLDTSKNTASSVLQLVKTWHELARVGRGRRKSIDSGIQFTLDANYQMKFRYDFTVKMLRGTTTQGVVGRTDGPAKGNLRTTELKSGKSAASRNILAQLKESAKASWSQINRAVQRDSMAEKAQSLNTEAQTRVPLIIGALDINTTYVIRQAWCGGFKLGELSYTNSGVQTLEATFYPEAVECLEEKDKASAPGFTLSEA